MSIYMCVCVCVCMCVCVCVRGLLLTPFWFFPLCQCDVTQKIFERYSLHRMHGVFQILMHRQRRKLKNVGRVFYYCHFLFLLLHYPIKKSSDISVMIWLFNKIGNFTPNQISFFCVCVLDITIYEELSDVHSFTSPWPEQKWNLLKNFLIY